MSKSLDIGHLRTLVAIADCGGFGRAAVVRHLSQPALSQHVRLLERSLQRTLFERDGRQMRLTADGETVLAEARQVLAAHDQALERLALGPAARLTLGVSAHVADQVLPGVLRSLGAALPDLVPRVEIGRSAALAEAAERGGVDVALVLGASSRGGGEEVVRLPLAWYAAPAWEPPADGPWPLVALDEPSSLREAARAALEAAGRTAAVAAQSSSVEGVLTAARAGLGVALLPVDDAGHHGLVSRPDLPSPGAVRLAVISRRGFDPVVGAAVVGAVVQAAAHRFAERPQLRLVHRTEDRPDRVGAGR